MKTNLDDLPVELRKVVIKKIRWCMAEVQGGIEGCSIECPYDKSHFMLYRYSRYLGIELVHCTDCGYRYILTKTDKGFVLKNMPEIKKKGLVIRKK